MAPLHPSGILFDIVGIRSGDRGRSCEEHEVCGRVLELDSVVCIWHNQIKVFGNEQAALTVYWATDGVDRCQVGFLPKHLLKCHEQYNGKLAQVVEFPNKNIKSEQNNALHNWGFCHAVIIDAENTPKIPTANLRLRRETSQMKLLKTKLVIRSNYFKLNSYGLSLFLVR